MGWRNAVRWGRAVAAAVALLVAVQPAMAADSGDTRTLPQTVNTFIGTRDEGNTFPGASAPFGLIQVSLDGSGYRLRRAANCTSGGFTSEVQGPDGQSPFAAPLPNGVSVSVNTFPVVFDSLGRPSAAASASCTIALFVTMVMSRPARAMRAFPVGNASVGNLSAFKW